MHFDAGAAERTVANRDRPSGAVDDCLHDREPETRSTVVAAAILAQAREPLEHPRPIVLRNTRAVVVDRQHDRAAHVAHRYLDARPGVAIGIVDEVAEDAPELIGSAPRDDIFDRTESHRDVTRARCLVGHDLGDLDRLDRRGDRVVVGTSQLQETVDECLHPVVLVEIPVGALAAGVGVALMVGGIAGFYPAARAARLEPADAVRAA